MIRRLVDTDPFDLPTESVRFPTFVFPTIDMKPSFLRFVAVPAAVLLPLTLTRGWLEVYDPDNAKWLSVLAISFALLAIYPWLLRNYALSLKDHLVLCAKLVLAIRIPISLLYTFAFARQWTIDGSSNLVRYVTDLTEKPPHFAPDTAPLVIFFGTLLISTAVHLVVAAVAYLVSRKLLDRPSPA